MLHSKKGRKEGEGGRGGGVGDQFESSVEIHSIFFGVFFLHVLLLFFYGLWRGGGKLLKLFVSLNRILKGGSAGGCFNGLGELHVSMDSIRVFQ